MSNSRTVKGLGEIALRVNDLDRMQERIQRLELGFDETKGRVPRSAASLLRRQADRR